MKTAIGILLVLGTWVKSQDSYSYDDDYEYPVYDHAYSGPSGSGDGNFYDDYDLGVEPVDESQPVVTRIDSEKISAPAIKKAPAVQEFFEVDRSIEIDGNYYSIKEALDAGYFQIQGEWKTEAQWNALGWQRMGDNKWMKHVEYIYIGDKKYTKEEAIAAGYYEINGRWLKEEDWNAQNWFRNADGIWTFKEETVEIGGQTYTISEARAAGFYEIPGQGWNTLANWKVRGWTRHIENGEEIWRYVSTVTERPYTVLISTPDGQDLATSNDEARQVGVIKYLEDKAGLVFQNGQFRHQEDWDMMPAKTGGVFPSSLREVEMRSEDRIRDKWYYVDGKYWTYQELQSADYHYLFCQWKSMLDWNIAGYWKDEQGIWWLLTENGSWVPVNAYDCDFSYQPYSASSRSKAEADGQIEIMGYWGTEEDWLSRGWVKSEKGFGSYMPGSEMTYPELPRSVVEKYTHLTVFGRPQHSDPSLRVRNMAQRKVVTFDPNQFVALYPGEYRTKESWRRRGYVGSNQDPSTWFIRGRSGDLKPIDTDPPALLRRIRNLELGASGEDMIEIFGEIRSRDQWNNLGYSLENGVWEYEAPPVSIIEPNRGDSSDPWDPEAGAGALDNDKCAHCADDPNYPGVQGEQGEDGPRGEDGQNGADGAPGAQGPAGPAGPRGEPGVNGLSSNDDGADGDPGVDGEPGPHGRTGNPGAPGADGAPGKPGQLVAGPRGPRGPDGKNGPKGKPGLPGPPGLPGGTSPNTGVWDQGYAAITQPLGKIGAVMGYEVGSACPEECPPGPPGPPGGMGYKGYTGPPGSVGPAGKEGPPGKPGFQGPTGVEGKRGKMGIPGETGKMGAPGPKGHRGMEGAFGESGEMGVPGETGSPGVMGPKGGRGQPGIPGESGRDGKRGIAGETGKNGVPGKSGLPGPKGQSGDMGADGERGTPGETGAPGENGEVGTKGEKGEPGIDGETGKMGRDGEDGTPGEMGKRGEDGQPGVQGQIGLPGMAGEMGRPGIVGKPGAKGFQGKTGKRGEPGDIGKPGYQGKTGWPGIVGETGISGESGKMGPPGESGDKGDKGIPGGMGKKGAPGESGRRGDLGFVGPRGAAGHEGPIGKKGPTGDIGPMGLTGNTGEPGREPSPEKVAEICQELFDTEIRAFRNKLRALINRPRASVIRGPRGPKGTRGQRGPKGNQGIRGEDGRRGIRGMLGAPGKDGQDGDKGAKGPPGPRGKPVMGMPGPRGPDGFMGQSGKSMGGKPGDTGRPGLLGGIGEVGKQGDMGEPGICDNSPCFPDQPANGLKGPEDLGSKGPNQGQDVTVDPF